jgi:hypothetical protein
MRGGRIEIRPACAVRAGWAEAARNLSARPGSTALDVPSPTRFDEEDWEW